MKRLLLIAAAGAILGVSTAFGSAQIFNSIDVNSEHPRTHWYDGSIDFLAPAGILDRMLVPINDCGFTGQTGNRIEGIDLRDAMILNALGWAVIVLGATALIRLVGISYHSVVRALSSHGR